MPKAPRPAPGDVVEQVTQTRIIPAAAESAADDDPDVKPSDGKPRDAFDYMASLTPVEVDSHLVYVYREYPPGESGYIDCMKPPIDEAYVKKEFGGGTYNVLVKKGSEIKRGKKFKVIGTPLTPGTHSNGAGSSDLVQTVRMILEKERGGGGSASDQITLVAFKNALELQRASTPPPMSPKDMMEMMVNMQKLNGGGGAPDWLSKASDLLLPGLAALLIKMLEPKDPLTAMKTVGEAMGMLKTLSGGTEKSSFLTELGRNAPMLLSEGSKFLAEMRAAAAQNAQNATLARLPAGQPQPVMPAVHSEPARPAPAAIPAAAPAHSHIVDQSAIEAGRPSPEWVFGQVVAMCQQGQPGGVAFDFIEQIDPEFAAGLAHFTIEQIRTAIETDEINPVLKQLVALPGFEKFLVEFHTAAKEAAAERSKPPLPN